MTDGAKPMVIAVAPNGARRSKADHPALPITPDDLADAAAQCQEAGASLVHLHVRGPEGRHLLDADAYRAAMRAVRRAVSDDMIIQVTSEAAGRYRPEQQMSVIRDLKPEAVSLALCEFVHDAAGEVAAGEFFLQLWRERVLMQFILYSKDDVRRYRDLKARGIVPGGTALFVLGRYGDGKEGRPADLLPFVEGWPEEEPWMACAFGRRENTCAMTAAALGGHARVGFENNLHMADGRMAPDNAALVEQLAKGAALVGRSVADAATARRVLAGGAP